MRVPVLAGRRVLLGVTGSIAAYKAAAVASRLAAAGALVDALLTPRPSSSSGWRPLPG